MSELDLLKLQAAKETTWGSPLTDTVKFMDLLEFDFDDFTKAKVLRSRVGNLSNSRKAVLLATGGKWKAKFNATYEDINYWLEAIFGVVSPSGSGPYVRTATAPGSAAIAPRIHTLYYGDAAGGIFKLAGCVPSKFKFDSNANEEATFDVEGFYKSVVSGASFASLSDRATTPITGNDLLTYIDAFGGTIGTTALATVFHSLSIEIDSKRDTKKFLGSLGPGGYKQPAWEIKTKLHAEYNTDSDDWLLAQIAASAVFQKLMRFKFTQSANLIQQFDIAGTTEKSTKVFDEEDGVAAIDLEFTDTYETTFAAIAKYSNTCGVAVLA
jgi:tail tube protein